MKESYFCELPSIGRLLIIGISCANEQTNQTDVCFFGSGVQVVIS